MKKIIYSDLHESPTVLGWGTEIYEDFTGDFMTHDYSKLSPLSEDKVYKIVVENDLKHLLSDEGLGKFIEIHLR